MTLPIPALPNTGEIKRQADFLAIVGVYVPSLKRCGRGQYRCLCPFHSERHPSCYIHPERKIFYCFGCGAGGDVFAFIMRAENCDFRRAVEIVAGFSGSRPRERAPQGLAVSSGRRGLPSGLPKAGGSDSQFHSHYAKPEPKPRAIGELPPLAVDCAAERSSLLET